MKNLILTIICLAALTGTMKAEEDYLPFVVEGKVWNTHSYPARATTTSSYWSGKYFIAGDTVINDIVCKKIYSYNVQSHLEKNTYEGALYETGKEVYFIRQSTNQGQLLYKFDLKLGETMAGSSLQLLGREAYKVGGKYRKYHVMYYVEGKDPTDYHNYGLWVEGVGTTRHYPLFNNPTQSLVGGPRTFIDNCVVNGDTIYDSSDNPTYELNLKEDYATGISTVKAGAKARAESWYDLQGRQGTRPEKGRIYIHDGRKVVR